MFVKTRFVLLAFVLSAFLPSYAKAAPLSPENVPDPLKPWIGWVLRGDVQPCPYLDGAEDSRICTWSSKLILAFSDKTGTFHQQWRVYQDSWIPLPGNDERWPQDVKIDNQPGAVILMDDQPMVLLKKGTHSVEGSFLWDSIPESFQIPKDTGVFQLTVNGAEVPFPSMDENGLVWLHGKEQTEEAEDSLQLRVHRYMDDGVPFELTTHLSLDVSGKTREVVVGPVVLKNFTPMSVNSALPVDIQPDGFLRVQARAGQWEIYVTSRHKGPVASLTLPEKSGAQNAAWPEEEVWVFKAENDLRLVSVEGVAAVDPQQTTLPDQWKTFPAYRVTPGDTVKLMEQRRGDSNPAPDQLSLDRNYWLDFDGSGYTINDNIAGTLSSSQRLDMNEPLHLGRVSVNGDNQLITNLPGEKKEGIEIRHGQVQIVADSRLEDGGKVPAIGWDHNFQRVSGLLHLPPGWKVFAVTGADHCPSTWINQWSLLEIFLVLILTISFAKMWGRNWGIIAFITFALTFPEPDAPQWIWLAVLAGAVLLRLITKGKLQTVLKLYRLATLVILVSISLPFMVDQIRLALYPSYEYSQQINTNQSLNYGQLEQQIQAANMSNLRFAPSQPSYEIQTGESNEAAPPPVEAPKPEAVQEEMKVEKKAKIELGTPSQTAYQQSTINSLNYGKINPTARVQTGPGLPRWEGNTISLQWTGPVEKNQWLHLSLISPAANLVLSFLRVFLLVLLALCVIEFPRNLWPSFRKQDLAPSAAVFLIAGLIIVSFPSLVRADFPSPELLKDLQESLTENPDCFPSCASISRMHFEVAGGILRIRLEAAAQDATAIPLPGALSDWTPQQVLVDGETFPELHRDEDGNLWLKLSPGAHQIVMEGSLPRRTTVQIPLPMKPHHMDAQVEGWTLDGLHEDGIADDNLQLTRLETNVSEEELRENKTGSLPPFVQIQRRLILGLNWEMETHVTRLTPAGSAVILEVPLLDGESVTTSGMRVSDGKVQVSMGPQVSDIQWNSVLKESSTIHLQASDSYEWAETWQLDASPLWHVSLQGIPVIHNQSTEGTWLPEWRPWPGEKVEITVLRPQAVTGQTITIDQSLLSVTPGLRYSEISLSINLRSSLGGQHEITLPAGAELQSVLINGVVQPIRQVGQKLTLPIIPGEQAVELKWQQPGGIRSFFKSPEINLGLPSVNAETQFHLPPDRWIFFVGGPGVGPAVLFWGFLVVLVLVAIGLGRVPLTPLRAHHWLLLGLGLSQVPIWASVMIAGWLLLLGWRKDRPLESKYAFDFIQFLLVPWTITALVLVFVSIRQGLLGIPDMQIQGNNSSTDLLRWFQDRSPEILQRPWVFSLPMYCYRITMLAWALWLAIALVGWLKWAWTCFSATALWKPLRKKKPEVTPPPTPPTPEPAPEP